MSWWAQPGGSGWDEEYDWASKRNVRMGILTVYTVLHSMLGSTDSFGMSLRWWQKWLQGSPLVCTALASLRLWYKSEAPHIILFMLCVSLQLCRFPNCFSRSKWVAVLQGHVGKGSSGLEWGLSQILQNLCQWNIWWLLKFGPSVYSQGIVDSRCKINQYFHFPVEK